jgi:hypothetical protein
MSVLAPWTLAAMIHGWHLLVKDLTWWYVLNGEKTVEIYYYRCPSDKPTIEVLR